MIRTISLMLGVILGLTGCKGPGRAADTSASSALATSSASVVDTSSQIMIGILDQVSRTAPIAQNENNFWMNSAYAASCTNAITDPSTACVNGTTPASLLKTYSTCDLPKGGTLSGNLELQCTVTVGGASTCDCFTGLSILNGRTVNATGTLTTTSGGISYTWSSVAHTAYSGATVSGGITAKITTGSTAAVTINGVQRKITANGATVYDASVYSNNFAIDITTGLGPYNRTIAGTLTVDDATNKQLYTVSFSNVKRGQIGCCYPTQGVYTIVKSSGATISGAFNGCGIVDMTEGGVTTRTALTSCY